MLTRDIIELLKANPNLRASEIAETLNAKKTIVNCTLNYFYRRKLVLRDVKEKRPIQLHGRRMVYTYRVNDDALKDGTGMVVGKIGAVSNEERSPAIV